MDEVDIRRAQRAEMILNDDLFKEAVQKLRDGSLEDFKSAKPGDTEALLNARMSYDAIERFINIFAGIIRNGKYTKLRMDEAKPKLHHPDNAVFKM